MDDLMLILERNPPIYHFRVLQELFPAGAEAGSDRQQTVHWFPKNSIKRDYLFNSLIKLVLPLPSSAGEDWTSIRPPASSFFSMR